MVIAPNAELFHRADVDERENPGKGHHHNDLWSSLRCTVVYIGTVAIGLTVVEMSEAAERERRIIRSADRLRPQIARPVRAGPWLDEHPRFPDRVPLSPDVLALPASRLDPTLARDVGLGPFGSHPGHCSRAGEGHGRNRAVRRGGRAPGGYRTPALGISARAVAPRRGGAAGREGTEGQQRGTAPGYR